jgi:FdhD protein
MAVAFTYNGGTYAVMMATPCDLEDFAVGLSLTEGIIRTPAEIDSLEVIESDAGVELRMWVPEHLAAAVRERRRHLAGPTGCGLCGIESLTEAMRVPPSVGPGPCLSAKEIMAAVAAVPGTQAINRETRAVHAAALWLPDRGLVAVREDVGRHNALDKMGGAVARAGHPTAGAAAILTSRVSIEMVQKTAVLGIPVVIAVSAPTALAVRTAEEAGITLVAVARADAFEVFTHPDRITMESTADVA